MTAFYFGAGAGFFYILGLVFQGLDLRGKEQTHKYRVWFFCTGAVLLHSAWLYRQIFVAEGVDLGLYNIFSLVSLQVIILVLLGSAYAQLENLLILAIPVTLFSIVLAILPNESYQPRQLIDSGIAIHILISILAYSVLSLAAVQALLLAFQNRQIKQHHTNDIIATLPPIEKMESLLFLMLWIGIGLLSAAIASGYIYLEDMFAQHVVHKTVLTLVSWIVFAILLWGRYQLGWRGSVAIRWTWVGFSILMLAFLGSKLVAEIVL
ncbi:MAG: cytochrome c biogenesis protein CcsA [Pseudomonadales bacterium]|nr:cytochrome c biogenesis protein CcsA [Pseudomonadales bacterium]